MRACVCICTYCADRCGESRAEPTNEGAGCCWFVCSDLSAECVTLASYYHPQRWIDRLELLHRLVWMDHRPSLVVGRRALCRSNFTSPHISRLNNCVTNYIRCTALICTLVFAPNQNWIGKHLRFSRSHALTFSPASVNVRVRARRQLIGAPSIQRAHLRPWLSQSNQLFHIFLSNHATNEKWGFVLKCHGSVNQFLL